MYNCKPYYILYLDDSTQRVISFNTPPCAESEIEWYMSCSLVKTLSSNKNHVGKITMIEGKRVQHYDNYVRLPPLSLYFHLILTSINRVCTYRYLVKNLNKTQWKK